MRAPTSPAILQTVQSMVQTPYIIIDERVVERNYRSVSTAFGASVEVFYAMKANNHPTVIRLLDRLGSGFDIASAGELRLLRSFGIAGSRVAFSNPVKIPADISYAYEQGVRLFAADTVAEVEKLAILAPSSDVYMRVAVDNSGSGWPLFGKFGASCEEAVAAGVRAKELGLRMAGLTFHVGSQCENVVNWRHAISDCAKIWNKMKELGIEPYLLDIGGGLPAPYRNDVPTVAEVGTQAMEAVRELLPDARRIIIEPGRFMVAEAGTFVASVIGMATRNGELKATLDAGLFSGLMEAYEAFWYPTEVVSDRVGDVRMEKVTLVGPTCDSVDVIAKDIMLPALQIGDRIVFSCAGAYTNSYENYNGFAFPVVHTLADIVGREEVLIKERPRAGVR